MFCDFFFLFLSQGEKGREREREHNVGKVVRQEESGGSWGK